MLTVLLVSRSLLRRAGGRAAEDLERAIKPLNGDPSDWNRLQVDTRKYASNNEREKHLKKLYDHSKLLLEEASHLQSQLESTKHAASMNFDRNIREEMNTMSLFIERCCLYFPEH